MVAAKHGLVRWLRLFAVGILISPSAIATEFKRNSLKFSGYLDLGVYRLAGGETEIGNIGRNYLQLSGQHAWSEGRWAMTFVLQPRFDLPSLKLESSGSTPWFQGEATVGLKSPYGSLRVGRALTPMWTRDWLYDPWENFNRVTSVAWRIFHPRYRSDPHHNGPAGEYARLNGGLFYDSPRWSGWHVHLSAGLRTRNKPDKYGQQNVIRPLGASINYDMAPWSAMMTAERNSANDRTLFFGASRKAGSVTLMGSATAVWLSESSRRFFREPHEWRSSMTAGATWNINGKTAFKLGLGRDFQGYNRRGKTQYVSVGIDYLPWPRLRLYTGMGFRFFNDGSHTKNIGAGVTYWF